MPAKPAKPAIRPATPTCAMCQKPQGPNRPVFAFDADAYAGRHLRFWACLPCASRYAPPGRPNAPRRGPSPPANRG